MLSESQLHLAQEIRSTQDLLQYFQDLSEGRRSFISGLKDVCGEDGE